MIRLIESRMPKISDSDINVVAVIQNALTLYGSSAPAAPNTHDTIQIHTPALKLCAHKKSATKTFCVVCTALFFIHYVEIPAVQSQQQSPSVGNAKKKKMHIYAYTS